MSRLEIEKGVPLPPKGSASRIYPFGQMEIGDSVFVPGRKSSNANSILTTWIRKGWKFTARNCEQDGAKGCRVWRVK